MIILIFADLRLLTTEQNVQQNNIILVSTGHILGLGSDMVRNGYEARYKHQAQGIAKAKAKAKAKAEGKYRCHRVNESLQALGIVTHRQ
ncbi:hypothetical protein CZ809_02389 [Photobacterium piscicola]|uniref:Uncharacterized protein n=2 Tax=Photobacterium piscicola TaxID=1378299 RepID=A0A1T5I1A9_9GAMM|nr:hypothetical protein CZ809_02389 [Photobacterium piscicola]